MWFGVAVERKRWPSFFHRPNITAYTNWKDFDLGGTVLISDKPYENERSVVCELNEHIMRDDSQSRVYLTFGSDYASVFAEKNLSNVVKSIIIKAIPQTSVAQSEFFYMLM